MAGRMTDLPPLEPATLRAMTQAIVHRGPDEDGHHIAPGIAMGMRRLSIIDLASSHQPLSNERSDVWTVFNGEIFNFPELRRELQSARPPLGDRGRHRDDRASCTRSTGLTFRSGCAGCSGSRCGTSPAGGWCSRAIEMGVKPLYYTLTSDGLAFGSGDQVSYSPGGLVEPPVWTHWRPSCTWPTAMCPGRGRLFDGVRKLAPPPTTLVWEGGELKGESVYWTFPLWEGAEPSGASWEEGPGDPTEAPARFRPALAWSAMCRWV